MEAAIVAFAKKQQSPCDAIQVVVLEIREGEGATFRTPFFQHAKESLGLCDPFKEPHHERS